MYFVICFSPVEKTSLIYIPLSTFFLLHLPWLNDPLQGRFYLTIIQLRVTAAQPGAVTFELDIQKEHTVQSSLAQASLLVYTTPANPVQEPTWHPPRWHNCKHGYLPFLDDFLRSPLKSICTSRPWRFISRCIQRAFRNRCLYRP